MKKKNFNKTKFFKKIILIFLLSLSLNNDLQTMSLVQRIRDLFISNHSEKLFLGAIENNTGEIEDALEHGTDINTKDEYGNTALHLATKFNNVEAVIMLLRYPECNIEALNNSQNTALHVAAIKNSLECAKLLIHKGINTNSKNKFLRTPLHIAVIKENVSIIEILIFSGASTNQVDSEGKTPMDYASKEIKKIIRAAKKSLKKRQKEIRRVKRKKLQRIQQEQREEQLRIEKEKITTIQSQLRKYLQGKRFNDEKEKTRIIKIQSLIKKYLQRKRFKQNEEFITNIQSLLRRKQTQSDYKEFKHRNKFNNNPEYRIKYFLSVIDNFLLELNGPINTLPQKKQILFKFNKILFLENLTSRQKRSNIQSFKYLIKHFKDQNGNNALHLFSKYGKYKYIPALISNGININSQNNKGETALHLAVEKDNYKTVKTLIYLGANPNIASLEEIITRKKSFTISHTPLTMAINMNAKRSFEILIQINGINLDFQSMPYNQTALHIAVELENQYAIKELIKAGANQNLRTTPSLQYARGAIPEELAFFKIDYAPELYACFDPEFTCKSKQKLIINIDNDTYNESPIKEKINKFTNWMENIEINLAQVRDKNRNNIFHYLAKYNEPEITRLVKVFKKHNGKINSRNRKGYTPLQIATIYGNLNMAQAFINCGAKLRRLTQ